MTFSSMPSFQDELKPDRVTLLDNLPKLPHTPGVYLMRDQTGAIIYIGKARDLKKRVASYFLLSRDHDSKTQTLVSCIRHIDYVSAASERDALILERKLINRFKPEFNIMWRDDKSYPFIALTMKEDYPRLFLTRKKNRDGTLYFGPYPTVRGIRKLLKWSWKKKLFPLRPCRLEIQEGKPYPYEKVKSCLYLHTGQCPAPCLGKISVEDYGKFAERARLFFEGNREELVEELEKEMKVLSKRQKYEEAAQVRDRIETLQHMAEHVTFREMTPEMLELRIRESRAVQELMRNLNLPKPPQVIECYDISHIQGTEKVASMVQFEGGRPKKSEYRKFIIRTVEGIDDFKSMAEVVGRRMRRLKNEGRPFPDLMVIDGGKGQLSSALEALEKEEIKGVPIIALAKEEEEVFVPKQSRSIRLPQDSAGLLLLRHIRDEAHRFAITFHRHRRNKLTMKGDIYE